MSKNEEPNPADADDTDSIPDEDPDRTVPMDHDVVLSPGNVFDGGKEGAPPASTEQWEALTPEDLNSQLPDFRVVELLGRGGMGAVYMAIQKSLDRPVAIKVLPPVFARDSEFEVRFRREAKAMATLNHPNIIHIHDFGQTVGKLYYFVMEFVDGADLHQLIKQGKVAPDTALKVVIQVCEALQYAHNNGYVHRDVKPANILLTKDGFVKVGDFGLAKLIDPEGGTENEQPELTMTGRSLGTPNYMAPEQFSAKEDVDHRTDIYSLGVMFYEMLTGEVPRGSFEPPSGKTQLDIRIDDIVLKAMHESPEKRYQAAKDVESDVEIVRTDPRGTTMARMEKKRRKVKRRKSKKGLAWALLSLLVGGLVVGGVIWKPWEKSNAISDNAPPVAGPVQPVDTGLPPSLVSKIKLPPALAAMKRRGGALRVWSSPLAEEPINPVSQAEGISDFTSVALSARRWIALRSDGTVKVSDSRQSQKFESLQHVKQIKAGSGYFALLQDGSLVEEVSNPGGSEVNRPFPNGVVDFDVSYGTGGFILPSGKVEFRTWDDPDLVEIFPKWNDVINRRTDNISVAIHDSGIGSVLRADGTFLRFSSTASPAETPEVRDVVKVARGGHWLALREDGKVFSAHYKKNAIEAEVPANLGNAFDVKADLKISAAQMEDGSWVAWGDNSMGIIDKINSLGPAVDIAFHAKGYIVWIEPEDPSPNPRVEKSSPKIELPSALAAMKKRGGTLRAWGETDSESELEVKKAEGTTDLVSIFNTYEEWMGIRVNGTVLSSEDHHDKIEMLSNVSKAQGGTALQTDGTLTVPSASDRLTGIQDFATGNQLLFTLYRNGKLEASATKKEPLEATLDIIDSIKSLGPVRLVSNRPTGGDGAAVQHDGKVVCWHHNPAFEVKVDGSEFVEIASAFSAWIGLKEDGTVATWVDPSKPDAEKGAAPIMDPDLPGKAFALRTEAGIAAVQLEDGRWHAWGIFGKRELIDTINQMGPALDLRFCSGGKGFWWIEPTDANSPERASSPRIEIPPALAAMTSRGGKTPHPRTSRR